MKTAKEILHEYTYFDNTTERISLPEAINAMEEYHNQFIVSADEDTEIMAEEYCNSFNTILQESIFPTLRELLRNAFRDGRTMHKSSFKLKRNEEL